MVVIYFPLWHTDDTDLTDLHRFLIIEIGVYVWRYGTQMTQILQIYTDFNWFAAETGHVLLCPA